MRRGRPFNPASSGSFAASAGGHRKIMSGGIVARRTTRGALAWMAAVAALMEVTLMPARAPAAEVSLHAGGPRVNKSLVTLRDLKTRHVVLQQYDFSCGAASIATVLTYYFGEPATEKEMIYGIAEFADIKK